RSQLVARRGSMEPSSGSSSVSVSMMFCLLTGPTWDFAIWQGSSWSGSVSRTTVTACAHAALEATTPNAAMAAPANSLRNPELIMQMLPLEDRLPSYAGALDCPFCSSWLGAQVAAPECSGEKCPP